MGFFDYLGKKKKEFGDAVSSLGATAKSYLHSLQNTPAPKVLQNTIGRLPSASQTFKPVYDTLSNINTRPLSSRATSPVGKLVAGVAETPYTFLTSVPKAYGQTMKEIDDKSIFTPGGVKRTAGRALEAGLDTASIGLLGAGKNLVKHGVKSVAESAILREAPKMSGLIRAGAKQGMKTGGLYGAGYGTAEALKEEKGLGETVKDAATGAATGSLIGGGVGGSLPALGAIAKAVKHDLSSKKAPTDLVPNRTVYQENTLYPSEKNSGLRTFTPEKISGQTFADAPLLGKTLRQVGEALPHPGASIEDVSGKPPLIPSNKNTQAANAVNTKKNASAKEAVAQMMQETKAKNAPVANATPKPTPKPALVTNAPARSGNGMESDTSSAFAKELDTIPTPWGENTPPAPSKGNMKPVGEIIGSRSRVKMPDNKREAVAQYDRIVRGRPVSPETDTIGKIFDAHVNTEKNVSKNTKPKQSTESPDPFAPIPEGTSKIFRHEPNVTNYDTWLRVIGIRSAKERKKISFPQAKELIHNWRVQNQPEYTGKQAEISRFKNFVADFQNALTKGVQRGKEFLSKYSFNPEQNEQIIRSLDQPGSVPDDIAPAVQAIRNEQDALFREAKDAGLDVSYWRDYVTHIWRETPEQVARKIRIGLKKGIITMDDISGGRANLTETPFFGPANSRLLTTYEAGERIGLHKRYNNPAQILAHYVTQLERAKSIVRGIADLKKSGLVVEGKQPNTELINVPGAEGLSAEPELAKQINNAFGSHEYTTIPGKILGKAANVSRWLKDTLMSGGIPYTTVNSYGLSMTLKEIGTLSPTRAVNAVKSFVVANSPGASRRFFEENLGQIEKIRNNDIQISTMLDDGGFVDHGAMKNFFGDLANKGFFGGAKELWHKAVNEPTFSRFLPMNQILFFNSVESSLLKKGYPPQAAEIIAAKELREGMGLGSAAKDAAKSKLWKDWMETLFFAPTHRMNMIRVFANAAKTLGRNPFTPGNQSAAQFLVGGMAVYAMYDWVNYANTGHHLYENPEGKKFETFIDTGDGNYVSIPYMPSVATMPRLAVNVGENLIDGDLTGAGAKAWQGTGSLLSKPLADVAVNEDYFGKKIANEFDSPEKQWTDRAKYLGTQYTGHPYVKAAIAASQGTPTSQVVAQLVEAPVRFSSEGSLASNKFWGEYNDTKPTYERFMRLTKSDPEAASAYFSENKDAINRYKELESLRSMYSTLKEGGSKEDFGNILNENGFAFKTNGSVNPLSAVVNTASANEGSGGSDSGETLEHDEQGNAVWRGQKIYTIGGKVYVPSLEGTKKAFDSEDKAVLAIEKEDFEASSDPSRIVGKFIFRRNPDGTAAVPERIEKYTLARNEKRMGMQKDDKDFEGWYESGTKQLELLGTMLDDPTLDELDRMEIEDKIHDLTRLRDRYLSFGGSFDKPKKEKKLPEAMRYPLVDKDMLEVSRLLNSGGYSKKPSVSKHPLSLIPARITSVRRKSRRRILH